MRKFLFFILAVGILFGISQSVDVFNNFAQAGIDFEGIMRAIEEDSKPRKTSESEEKERKRQAEEARRHDLENEARSKAAKEKVKDKIVMKKWGIGKEVKLGEPALTDWTTRTEIDLPDGNKIDIDVDTQFQIDISKGKTIISMTQGRIRALVQPKSKFEIQSHISSGGVRGTEFIVELTAISTIYQVLNGTVEVKSFLEGKSILVPAGYKVFMDDRDTKLGEPQLFDVSSVDRWWEMTPSEGSMKTAEKPSFALFLPSVSGASGALAVIAILLLSGFIFVLIKKWKIVEGWVYNIVAFGARMKTKTILLSVVIILTLAVGGVAIWKTNFLQQSTVPKEKVATTTLTPEQVSENFYTWYIGCLEGTVGTEKAPCKWRQSEYVSDKLTKNIKGNGYDPIICAQNLPDTSEGSVVVKDAEISDDKAKATIDIMYNWKDNHIEVELERIDNQWKIANLACPPTQSPDYIVGDFYASYINCQGGQVEAGGSLPGYCLYGKEYSGSSKELFTDLAENIGGSPELIKNIKWAQGADPILCAQDLPPSIRVKNVNVVGDYASVTVIEDFITPIPIQVDLKLHRELGLRSWQIVSITCPEQP